MIYRSCEGVGICLREIFRRSFIMHRKMLTDIDLPSMQGITKPFHRRFLSLVDFSKVPKSNMPSSNNIEYRLGRGLRQ